MPGHPSTTHAHPTTKAQAHTHTSPDAHSTSTHLQQRPVDGVRFNSSVPDKTSSTAKGLEPEAGERSKCPVSNTIAQKKGFLPLLPDVPQQRQTKLVSTDESNYPATPRTYNENRHAPGTGGHGKEHTFLPLLPVHGPNTGSVSPECASAGALNTERPSHEHQEHIASQENNESFKRSRSERPYEWPLIINGVYQGEGPLPPCRIEENESPTEPRPYGWPLIILHRARSAEQCDQQAGPDGKVATENTTEGEEKVEGSEQMTIAHELGTTDGVSAER